VPLLFDLHRDPGERRDQSSSNPQVLGALQALLPE